MNTPIENIQLVIYEDPLVIPTIEQDTPQKLLSENITITIIEESDNHSTPNTCSIIQREASRKEIKKQVDIRKQTQIEKLKEKYGEEEYKKIQAQKMAEYRRRKKIQQNQPPTTQQTNPP